jgi:nicotinate-nucleotide adenylyltransferase
MKKVGLYFGSFNPIHNGHLRVAKYVKEHGGFDEIWFVPSPLNPHKSEETLIPADLRLNWVQKTLESESSLICSSEEFQLPKPSYTHKSVVHFYAKYPEIEFSLIMGADNLYGFHKWQHAQELSEMCPLHVYARPGYEKPQEPLPFNATWYEAPLIEISATQIRDLLWDNVSVDELVPTQILSELTSFFESLQPNSSQ